ncbi:UvrD-helicase domain-containing protein [Natrialbaceae archaeon A-CW3]
MQSQHSIKSQLITDLKDESAYVLKITGTAGSGKSWLARRRINDLWFDKKYVPSDFLVVSFLKSHVKEVEADFREDPKFEDSDLFLNGVDEKGGATVATLNSICYRLSLRDGVLTPPGSTVIAANDCDDEETFSEFFDEMSASIRFEYLPKRPLRLAKEEGFVDAPSGNKIIDAYNYLRTTKRELTVENLDSTIPFEIERVSSVRVVELMKEWEQYKSENDLWQHHDYCRYVDGNDLVPEEYKVVFVDEFQDLSPLQYSIYETWRDSGALDTIIISGDPAQSIFSFRGGASIMLRDTPADDAIHRDISRRCRQKILNAATAVLQGEDSLDKLTAEPTNMPIDGLEDGLVRHVRPSNKRRFAEFVERCLDFYVQQENKENIMLLAKTNGDIGRMASALTEAGIPYSGLADAEAQTRQGLWYWAFPAPQIFEAMRTIESNVEMLPFPLAKVLLENASTDNTYTKAARTNELAKELSMVHYSDNGSKLRTKYVLDWLEAEEPVDLARECTPTEAQASTIITAFQKEHTYNPMNVRIGTIHSAKGSEADAVILNTRYSDNHLQRFRSDTEFAGEECRLYYTAATRAKDALYLMKDWNASIHNEFPPIRKL